MTVEETQCLNQHDPLELTASVVGNQISFGTDHGPVMTVIDPRPFGGPVHRQAGIMTEDSAMILRQITIENRQAPIMVPIWQVSADLVKNGMVREGIDGFRRFINDHPEHRGVSEVRLLLAMAFNESGYAQQAERQLELMLQTDDQSELISHALFELACLRIEEEHGRFDRAIRTVLSYQQEQECEPASVYGLAAF